MAHRSMVSLHEAPGADSAEGGPGHTTGGALVLGSVAVGTQVVGTVGADVVVTGTQVANSVALRGRRRGGGKEIAQGERTMEGGGEEKKGRAQDKEKSQSRRERTEVG